MNAGINFNITRVNQSDIKCLQIGAEGQTERTGEGSCPLPPSLPKNCNLSKPLHRITSLGEAREKNTLNAVKSTKSRVQEILPIQRLQQIKREEQ